METYTIVNEIHGTRATVRCNNIGMSILPTDTQIKKLRQELCSDSSCHCRGLDAPLTDGRGNLRLVDTSMEKP